MLLVLTGASVTPDTSTGYQSIVLMCQGYATHKDVQGGKKKNKTCIGGKSLSPCYMHGVCPSKPEALLSLPAFSSTLLSTSPTRGILHAKYKCVAKIKAKL